MTDQEQASVESLRQGDVWRHKQVRDYRLKIEAVSEHGDSLLVRRVGVKDRLPTFDAPPEFLERYFEPEPKALDHD